MPLRIAIDIRRVRDFGVGTYIRNLVRSLAAIDTENRYVLVRSAGDAPELSGLPSNFETAVYKGSGRSGLSEIGFSMFLRGLVADVYHVPLNTVPFWMPRPYIVTAHDLANILFGNRPGFRNRARLFRQRRGLLRADRVIAVSNATRRDLERIGLPSERIRTIYNALDPAFSERRAPAIGCLAETGFHYPPDVQRILDRYQISYPFILYVGRTNPHKNIPRLVEAFAVVRAHLQDHPIYNDLRLIIIGDGISRTPSLRRAVVRSRVENMVRFLGFVPIETLRVFYQTASAFAFPSLYEGFGLPPLEAMACGTPVVCSHVSSLPEVVGDAAVIVDPKSVFDIARGLRDALIDRELRARLIERGFEQVRRFNWSHTAADVLDTYRRVAIGVPASTREMVHS